MKKFIFTALAVVAFCGISTAGTSESVEKVAVATEKCDDLAAATYNIWYKQGFSDETSRAKAKAAKDACEEELKIAAEKKKSLELTEQKP